MDNGHHQGVSKVYHVEKYWKKSKKDSSSKNFNKKKQGPTQRTMKAKRRNLDLKLNKVFSEVKM
jgi:hypothetical protein